MGKTAVVEDDFPRNRRVSEISNETGAKFLYTMESIEQQIGSATLEIVRVRNGKEYLQ